MSDGERAIVAHLEGGGDPLFRDWRYAGKNGPGTCHECGAKATHQSCFAGEPWVPFCAEHDLPDYYEHTRRRFWSKR